MTEENMAKLDNNGERLFARACLEKNLDIFYDIPVGRSHIDFYVINSKNPNTEGKLVEVTWTTRSNLCNLLGNVRGHKYRQIENMKQSGLPWMVLTGEFLKNLRIREK